MIRVVHEMLYQLFKDPYTILRTAGLEYGQSVLEVGCGPGFFTLPAAEIIGSEGTVVAVDLNPYAIAHVRKKIQKTDLNNITLLQRDVADTGLESGVFDVVFMFGFHHFTGDIDPILHETARVLKPDGVLVTEGIFWEKSPHFERTAQVGDLYQFHKRNTDRSSDN